MPTNLHGDKLPVFSSYDVVSYQWINDTLLYIKWKDAEIPTDETALIRSLSGEMDAFTFPFRVILDLSYAPASFLVLRLSSWIDALRNTKGWTHISSHRIVTGSALISNTLSLLHRIWGDSELHIIDDLETALTHFEADSVLLF